VAFALGGGLGYGLGRRTSTRSVPSYIAPTMSTAASSVTASASAPPPPPELSVSAAPSLAPPASSTSARSRSPGPHDRSSILDAERSLVEQARSALARGDASSAIAAVDEHKRRFPKGALAEEREVLAIRALLRSGQKDAARQRIDLFLRTYPESVFRPTVEEAATKAGE
jgi:hypothetical protein